MTFSISTPRKIGNLIHSNPSYSTTMPKPVIPSQTSKLYGYSVRMNMLGHLTPASGCTDCPNNK